MGKTLQSIVIVGAGMGGLAAAARLAHAGCDVTVLEAADHPGGKMRTLPTGAGPVDAGPTVMTMRHVFDALFEECGERLDDHVTLHSEPILARHFWTDGTTLDLFADRDRSAEAIGDVFGRRSAQEFLTFSVQANRLFDAFEGPMMTTAVPRLAALVAHVLQNPSIIPAMGPFSTLASSLKGQFTDPRLRQLFGRYATYVGGMPEKAPAVLALIAHSEARGVWRVDGGMHRLAEAMAALANRCGASLRFGTRATGLAHQSGGISAVRLASGEEVRASHVVFNGDPRALGEGYMGPAARQAVPRKGTHPRSLSARVWTFASAFTGPDLVHHNVFFGSDPAREFGPIARGNPPEDPTLYICAQDRGNGRRPTAIERFQIIENAAAIDTGRPEEITTCRTRTFQTLARFDLQFSPGPRNCDLTTPWEFETLFPGSLGSLYGRSPHGLTAAFARPTARTSLPGLYLAGGGAHPGAGVPMATLSGKHAAEAILTDLASTSRFRATATPGGMSTVSATMAPAPSRSSPS